MAIKIDSKLVNFYSKHRFEYAKVRMWLEYLDFLYTQPISRESISEFESVLNDLTLKFDDLTFRNMNCG